METMVVVETDALPWQQSIPWYKETVCFSDIVLQIVETLPVLVGPAAAREFVSGGRGHVGRDQLALRDGLSQLIPVQVSVPAQSR